MTHASAVAIAEWRYEPPYDFYLDADPEDLAEFLDPTRWSSSVAAFDGDDLVDSPSLRRAATWPSDSDSVLIALAGASAKSSCRQDSTFGMARCSRARIVLAVAEFNHRARRMYAKLGFTETRACDQATKGDAAVPLPVHVAPSDTPERWRSHGASCSVSDRRVSL